MCCLFDFLGLLAYCCGCYSCESAEYAKVCSELVVALRASAFRVFRLSFESTPCLRWVPALLAFSTPVLNALVHSLDGDGEGVRLSVTLCFHVRYSSR